jgi:glyoxylase-like metal-dependent hydrolase (beta-lactamase superfamily II)
MAETRVVTLDLNFQGMPHSIAAYLVRHADAVVLVECGPGSTVSALKAGLAKEGLRPSDVTHVLLTHIHLDHAGAAGWMARQGALIHVHPVGAPHMIAPQKLLRSARRIYGDQMDTLWGEFLPVPERQLVIVGDGQEVQAGGLRFLAIDTPGHAEHHHAYLLEETCFSGDIGGVRIPGFAYLRVPMPPPELNFEKWQASVRRLQTLPMRRIAPTHFGIFDDPEWQLREVVQELDAAERWLENAMRATPAVEELRRPFVEWMQAEGLRHGLDADAIRSYDLANPLGMSADGLFRYWHKVRNAASAQD